MKNLNILRAKSQIILSAKHKEAVWKLLRNGSQLSLIGSSRFSDKKCFSFDDSDEWKSCASYCEHLVRCKRQCQGGSVLVWMMVLPKCLLSFSVIEGNFRSADYIKHLKEKILLLIMIILGNDFVFQQDNASGHKSKEVQAFLKRNNIV